MSKLLSYQDTHDVELVAGDKFNKRKREQMEKEEDEQCYEYPENHNKVCLMQSASNCKNCNCIDCPNSGVPMDEDF